MEGKEGMTLMPRESPPPARGLVATRQRQGENAMRAAALAVAVIVMILVAAVMSLCVSVEPCVGLLLSVWLGAGMGGEAGRKGQRMGVLPRTQSSTP